MPEIKSIEARLGLSLNISNVEVLTLADTYYSLNSTFNIDESNLFTGTTFDGSDGTVLGFNGASQGAANKIARVTYALFINGLPIIQTPVDLALGKVATYSAVRFLTLNNGDVLEVKIKSDTALTDYTFNTLEIILKGF
jgi:hypothetical protein